MAEWLCAVVVFGVALTVLAIALARHARPTTRVEQTLDVPPPSGHTGALVPAHELAEAAAQDLDLPKLGYEADIEIEDTKVARALSGRQVQTKRIVYDEDAAIEDPTGEGDLILLTATARTDRGRRRRCNEDRVLLLEDEHLFVVADGMGGYNGGDIASQLAVDTMLEAFRARRFLGETDDSIPWRASELARSVQMANDAILQRARDESQLEGMGTTVCATRFAPRNRRLYVAHVGDSRMYRLRGLDFEQITSDHTMSTFGVTGAGAAHLSRAVGVWPTVPVDVIIGKPVPGDVYVLCSDGLTKMLPDAEISSFLLSHARESLEDTANGLVQRANDAGGRDNITVILVQVRDAIHHAASVAAQA